MTAYRGECSTCHARYDFKTPYDMNQKTQCNCCKELHTIEMTEAYGKEHSAVCVDCGDRTNHTWLSMSKGCQCGGTFVPHYVMDGTKEPLTTPSERFQWWHDPDVLAKVEKLRTRPPAPSKSISMLDWPRQSAIRKLKVCSMPSAKRVLKFLFGPLFDERAFEIGRQSGR